MQVGSSANGAEPTSYSHACIDTDGTRHFAALHCKRFDAVAYHKYNVLMMKFEWNPSKAASNLKKHKVSFEEAKSVFYDEFAIQFFDDEHSFEEDRFLMLGRSSGERLLIICHCECDHGAVIRIISARKATKRESAFYRGG
ncbi:MAG: BrnT family toxin [Xanthomonadaceae bacterium]|nr:BrnT family toxin [Xanthomonadaceae bacterium]MDZ4117178.1 BrnT family toxin [Xanthomonadaceae bacterium]